MLILLYCIFFSTISLCMAEKDGWVYRIIMCGIYPHTKDFGAGVNRSGTRRHLLHPYSVNLAFPLYKFIKIRESCVYYPGRSYFILQCLLRLETVACYGNNDGFIPRYPALLYKFFCHSKRNAACCLSKYAFCLCQKLHCINCLCLRSVTAAGSGRSRNGRAPGSPRWIAYGKGFC